MDDILGKLKQYIGQNLQNRQDEATAVTFPKMLKQQLKSAHPNLPQDDLSAIQENIRQDGEDSMMGMAAGVPAMKAVGMLEGPLAQLANKVPSHTFDKLIQAIRRPMVAEKNIGRNMAADKNWARIKDAAKITDEIPINPAKQLDEVSRLRNIKSIDDEIMERELKALKKQGIADGISDLATKVIKKKGG